MNQQINLYQDILVEKPAPFLFGSVLAVVLFVFVLVGLWGGYSYWGAEVAAQNLAAERQRERDKQALVAELQLKYPQRQPNPLLAEKIVHLERQLIGQKDAIHYFSNNPLTSNRIILNSLQRLAQKHVEGLWLTRIALADEGRNIALSGLTSNELNIPEFVGSLGESHVFGGAVFDSLTIARPKGPGARMEFTLSAKGTGQ